MKKILLFVFIVVFTNNLLAQASQFVGVQDGKINTLLEEKRKINTKITINDQYKIQIMHGDIESVKKVLEEFNTNFSDYDATIIFSSPNYKLWVGPFKNRIQATKALNEIKEKYNRALLIKPNK